MTRTLRLALVLLGTAPALTSCDYAKYSPGINTATKANFSWTPTWHTSDVSRDSISDRQRVEPAGGEGSAAAIKKGGAKAQLNAAPAGGSASSPESANGKLAPVADQSTSNAKTPVDKSQAPK
ncbi:hypothetical protein [Hymenobacter nivis]|uniref:Uncharacterized protein n=1 Tax=Hymenobacter nivis TaxID=1850093 RepID=A0A502GYU2_9BACT|nr:hypothetical protein [Hymenobacter nivis]TPG67577.1 hypothetical protein EAH73_07695 [Hymenobacter nivis]